MFQNFHSLSWFVLIRFIQYASKCLGVQSLAISACFVFFLKLWRRKGVECHKAIIEGYLQSMEFGQEDVVIWLDVCPNQFFASI